MSDPFVTRYWELRGPDGQHIVCDLVRTAAGLEVQCGHSDEQRRLRAAPVKSLADGLNLAQAWRAFYAEKGWEEG
jgi:hypothetical protein